MTRIPSRDSDCVSRALVADTASGGAAEPRGVRKRAV